MVTKKKTPTFGLLSVIFGVVGLIVFGIIFGLVAIICGALAVAKEQEQRAVVLGAAGIVIGVIDVLFMLILLMR